jgi:ABC-type uncharacterized transport system ATPase subunit
LTISQGVLNLANFVLSLGRQVIILMIILGAGKTTLLNYLSGKDVSRNLKKVGNVLFNGIPDSELKIGNFTAFVQ